MLANAVSWRSCAGEHPREFLREGVVDVTGTVTALLAASSSKGSSGGSTFIIFLVGIALVGYFLLIRPQKQRARRQKEQQSQIGVGDEVLTVGGIVGRVIAVDADRVTILSGADTVGFAAAGNEPTRLVLVRNAISKKIEPPVVTDADGNQVPDDATDTVGSYEDFGPPSQTDGHFETNGTVDGNGRAPAEGGDWSAEGAENEGTTS